MEYRKWPLLGIILESLVNNRFAFSFLSNPQTPYDASSIAFSGGSSVRFPQNPQLCHPLRFSVVCPTIAWSLWPAFCGTSFHLLRQFSGYVTSCDQHALPSPTKERHRATSLNKKNVARPLHSSTCILQSIETSY